MASSLNGTGVTFSDSTTMITGKQAVKAWVQFQGGNGNTAGTINGSYNVSSITVNGTGDYTANYTNAMPNTSYVVTQMSTGAAASAFQSLYDTSTTTTTSVRVQNRNLSNSNQNSVWQMIGILGA